ncbi:MAG: polysaccharide biosynthesis/export family protein [Methylococcaceae bacterium]
MDIILKHLLTFIAFFLAFTTFAYADSQPAAPIIEPIPKAQPVKEQPADTVNYLLSPGDLIEISVWKEEGMQKEQTLVAPDGNITFPLAGTLMAAGKPIFALQEAIAGRLANYIADPVVNIKLLQNNGNTIFVIGKVNKPGQYPANRRIDVMQALSLAGGLTVYADEDSIHILRRVGNEVKIFPFDYDDVLDGAHLEQNIILQAGDTVTVP